MTAYDTWSVERHIICPSAERMEWAANVVKGNTEWADVSVDILNRMRPWSAYLMTPGLMWLGREPFNGVFFGFDASADYGPSLYLAFDSPKYGVSQENFYNFLLDRCETFGDMMTAACIDYEPENSPLDAFFGCQRYTEEALAADGWTAQYRFQQDKMYAGYLIFPLVIAAFAPGFVRRVQTIPVLDREQSRIVPGDTLPRAKKLF